MESQSSESVNMESLEIVANEDVVITTVDLTDKKIPDLYRNIINDVIQQMKKEGLFIDAAAYRFVLTRTYNDEVTDVTIFQIHSDQLTKVTSYNLKHTFNQ